MNFILFFILSFPSFAASTVQYSSKAGQLPLTCTGSFGQSGLLQKVGYTEADLRKGIPCEVADFDNNGSNDIWFAKCDSSLKCPAAVVLMNKQDVLKVVQVQPEILMEVFTVKDRRVHGLLKDIGCKVPTTGALVKMGEGDGNMNVIYTLKKDKSGFEKFTECQNVESVD